jgi:predicted transposase YdaD
MFQAEIGKLEESEQAGVMQIVTSWMEQGIERGAEQEARSLILRLLTRRVGSLSSEVRSQVESLNLEKLESLGEALLDFSSSVDLDGWLRLHA